MISAPAHDAKERSRPRGVFINTGAAQCSIYESGLMVYNCVKSSTHYTLDYFSLDQLDLKHLASAGRARRHGDPAEADQGEIDFWVFNWHIYTMASHLDPAVIRSLQGPKFTVVLELAPDDPLKLVPPNVFDGYIALEPGAPAGNGIYPFARPLPGEPRQPPARARETPVIGSFGFGTPGKGFELLVESVNRAFDSALVRVNIPRGTYVGTDSIHRGDYAAHIASVCKKIAKPGIEVHLTQDFLTPEELVTWCGENDINCFMYTRSQPGLSATTDQAIMSGRPLLTLSNDTFRHIHQYVAPYPALGMREAIETTTPAVQAMQRHWSRQSFNDTFERMLADCGIITQAELNHSDGTSATEPATRVLVVTGDGPTTTDVLDYSVRLADAIGRTSQFSVSRIGVADLAPTIAAVRPEAVVLVDVDAADHALRGALEAVAATISVSSRWQSDELGADGVYRIAKQPIAPFYTVYERLSDKPAIWLLGFAAEESNLEAMIEKIMRERPGSQIVVERPVNVGAALDARCARLQERFEPQGGRISTITLPETGAAFISAFAKDCLAIVAFDDRREAVLEAYTSMALSTERAVFFTRAAPFPSYGSLARYIEDVSIEDAIGAGLAAHVPLLHDFGEWQMEAKVRRGLQQRSKAPPGAIPDAPPLALEAVLSLRGRAFVESAYRSVLARSPRPDETHRQLERLRQGASRADILVELRLSAEGQKRAAAIPGLANLVRRRRLGDLPVLGPLLRWLDWETDPAELERSLRIVEDELAGLLEARRTVVDEPRPGAKPPPPAPAPLSDAPLPAFAGKVHLLLVGTSDTPGDGSSGFTAGLEGALAAAGEVYRAVVWDGELKRFHVRTATGRMTVEPASCGSDNWLIVPDRLRASADSSLIEVNVVLEARRLGLRTAFVFHGADPLRNQNVPAPVSEGHERFMQALLLADLIVATSQAEANDLLDFFAVHQRADFYPPTHGLSPPSSSGTEPQWSAYWRQFNGLMARAADPTRALKMIYYLIAGAETPFDEHLVLGLARRGVAAVPVVWDEDHGRLAAFRPAEGHAPWSDWIEPGEAAPQWVLCADSGAPALAGLASYAKAHGLRVAAFLPAPRPDGQSVEPSREEFDRIEVLAALDKVFARSEDQRDALYRQLLAWRGKMHSADHRLGLIVPPARVESLAARTSGDETTPRAVEALVRIPASRPVDLATLAKALALASSRSARRLNFTVIGAPAGADALAQSAGGGCTIGRADRRTLCERLRHADFVIFAGMDGAKRSEVDEGLAWRKPCLVHAPPGAPAQKGVAFADFTSASELADAIATMADPEWLACLTEEARRADIRNWDTVAADIAAQLACDRPRDLVGGTAEVPPRDVFYARFANLRRRPALSVCISTYNRGGWIALNLENIFSQIGPAREDIEVLVVDNASTDHTSEVAARFAHRTDFRYIRNPRNVGMLGNLAVTSQTARGEFIWILGDDDFTRPGVIQRISDLIASRPTLELVYLNYGYTSENDPNNVKDVDALLDKFNVLEPDGPDVFATVAALAARCENFYTAIYAFAARRDHAMRAYCQDTSGRIFATMPSCIPSAYYILRYMANSPAYWIGKASLVVNSNVSWAPYGALLDLEHLPAAWDMAERMGCPPAEVDQRRANRLWLVAMMWREIFQNDAANNIPYFSAARTLMRLKHLPELDRYVPELRAVYGHAHATGHPAAAMTPSELFAALA